MFFILTERQQNFCHFELEWILSIETFILFARGGYGDGTRQILF